MSPLNNQSEKTTEEVLRGIVRDLVCIPGDRITDGELHLLGLDVDMADTIYQADIKPYLNYIMTYTSLDEMDPQAGHYKRNTQGGNPESWSEVLERHGMKGVHKKAVLVLTRMFTTKSVADNSLKVAIFLTRGGRWIVWHVETSSYSGNELKAPEVMQVFSNIEKLFAYMTPLVEGLTMRADHHGPHFLPLALAEGLVKLMEPVIKKRQEYLSSLQGAHDDGQKRLKNVDFTRN